MRIIYLMTFICALLFLAMVPALVQFARLSGLPGSAALTTVCAICLLAAAAVRRA
jgi:hypothetical protein